MARDTEKFDDLKKKEEELRRQAEKDNSFNKEPAKISKAKKGADESVTAKTNQKIDENTKLAYREPNPYAKETVTYNRITRGLRIDEDIYFILDQLKERYKNQGDRGFVSDLTNRLFREEFEKQGAFNIYAEELQREGLFRYEVVEEEKEEKKA